MKQHIHSFPWNGIDVQGFASLVTITGNRIEANGGRGLEISRVSGLVDANQFLHNGRPDGRRGQHDLRQRPRRRRARESRAANGVTVIEGNAEGELVYLYANRSLESGDLAEGETFLGSTTAGHFTFRFDGDLRGLYINGVATLYSSRHIEDLGRTTSEFGRATAVE